MLRSFTRLAFAAFALSSIARAAHADVEVLDTTEGCKEFRASGWSDSPWVHVRVDRIPASSPLVSAMIPVVAGEFEFELDISGKHPRGTPLRYTMWGAPADTPGSDDGGKLFRADLPCGSLSPKQKSCLEKRNAAWLKLFAAHNRDNEKCLREHATGETEFDECFFADHDDPKHPLNRARRKLVDAVELGACAEHTPAFAAEMSSGDLQELAALTSYELFTSVLDGAPLIANAESSPADARCQAAALAQTNAIAEAYGQSLDRAAKKALSGVPPFQDPAQSEAELRAGILGVMQAVSRVPKAYATAQKQLAKACRDGVRPEYFACENPDSVDELGSCVIAKGFAVTCTRPSSALGIDPLCVF